MVIIFGNGKLFYYRPKQPQVKRNLISSIKYLIYQSPHKLPNDTKLMILGNIEKISNLGGDIVQYPVFLSEIKLQQQQSKNTQNQISNISFPVKFTRLLYFVSNSLSRIVVPSVFSRKKFLRKAVKYYAKAFSVAVQVYLISLLCCKYFVQYCNFQSSPFPIRTLITMNFETLLQ